VRYVYTTLIVLLIVMILIFSLQNMSNVTISFLEMVATLPLALLTILIYVSGMVTGGFVFALIRSWIHGARRK
jgi:lipopolysaccharide assembly protein A